MAEDIPPGDKNRPSSPSNLTDTPRSSFESRREGGDRGRIRIRARWRRQRCGGGRIIAEAWDGESRTNAEVLVRRLETEGFGGRHDTGNRGSCPEAEFREKGSKEGGCGNHAETQGGGRHVEANDDRDKTKEDGGGIRPTTPDAWEHDEGTMLEDGSKLE